MVDLIIDIILSFKRFFQRIIYSFKGVIIKKNCSLNNVKFLGRAHIDQNCRLMGDKVIIIGDNFYLNVGCHLLGEITFGNNVQIGPQTVIWARDHKIDKKELINKQDHNKEPVFIGDDVWIGGNVTILKGVKIGNGVVIGAGSVVTKAIPDYAIAVGNPAKVIKYRE
jgi:acetyltransferase-like isoleucine patch superfamily enzyme